jgi:type IX secretion system PorP/SprF family membrane protein
MNLRQLLCTILLCVPALVFGQDPVFSQPLSAPALLNPALLGVSGASGVQVSYRHQWPALAGNYRTSYLGSHMYLPKLNGTVGLVVSYDNAANTIKTTTVGLSYGQHFRIGENWTVKPAFEVGYRQKELDWSQLSFGDEIDPRYGFVNPTSAQVSGGTATAFDFNFGILTHVKGFMFGGAMYHINEPNESLVSGHSVLPRRGSLQAAYTHELGVGARKVKIQPYFIYGNQANFDYMQVGVGMQVGTIICSFGALVNNALVGMLGYRHEAFHVAYSYDYTVSELTNASGGSHEVTLGWNFRRNIDPHENFVSMPSAIF